MRPYKVPPGYRGMTEFMVGAAPTSPIVRRTWRCSGCGKTSHWQKGWAWNGSLIALDADYVKNIFCPACVPAGAVFLDKLDDWDPATPEPDLLPDLDFKVKRKKAGKTS